MPENSTDNYLLIETIVILSFLGQTLHVVYNSGYDAWGNFVSNVAEQPHNQFHVFWLDDYDHFHIDD